MVGYIGIWGKLVCPGVIDYSTVQNGNGVQGNGGSFAIPFIVQSLYCTSLKVIVRSDSI